MYELFSCSIQKIQHLAEQNYTDGFCGKYEVWLRAWNHGNFFHCINLYLYTGNDLNGNMDALMMIDSVSGVVEKLMKSFHSNEMPIWKYCPWTLRFILCWKWWQNVSGLQPLRHFLQCVQAGVKRIYPRIPLGFSQNFRFAN